jgi:hypothetical protein
MPCLSDELVSEYIVYLIKFYTCLGLITFKFVEALY